MAKATLSFYYEVIITLLYLCYSGSVQIEANFTAWVNRQTNGDTYYLNSKVLCDSRTRTYLITEKRCVSDEELLNGRGVQLI